MIGEKDLPLKPRSLAAQLVSIVMPARNAAATIGVAIRSVLNQTFEDWELIVVDDCSNDDTDAVVKAIGDPIRRLPVTS